MESQEMTKYRNPVEYLKVFFRRRWLLTTPIACGLVLGLVACFILPPTYQSSTTILVEEEKIINPLIQGLAVSTSVAERMRTLREQILSWNSLVSLTKKLQLAREVTDQAGFEALIAKLRGNIGVQLRGPNIIRIAFESRSPQEAQLVTQTLTDIFVEENMRSQTKETDVAIEFIKEQLKVYKRKMKEAEIAKMQEQLKDLLVDATEQHPMVTELRQRMEAAQKDLDSSDYQVSGNERPIGSPVYDVITRELDKIIGEENATAGSAAFASVNTGEPADPNASIYKLMLMDRLDAVLARDLRVNENIYNMLLQKLETAKITQRLEASKQGTRYTIIDPPRLPLKPAKPNKVLVVLLGLFLGGCAGVGLVFSREFMDQSFLDIEDAKHALSHPVLGAISRLTTPEEMERTRIQKATAVVVFSLISLTLIVSSMLYAFLKKGS